MARRLHRLAAAACVGGIATALVAAVPVRLTTSTVVVTVADLESGLFIPDAQVRIPALGRIARTDRLGDVRFTGVPYGRHEVAVRRVGYAPGRTEVVVAHDTVEVLFRLERLAVLDTIRVTATATAAPAEFLARQRLGFGRYMDAPALDSARLDYLPFLLSTRFQGLVAQPDPERPGRYLLRSARAANGMRSGNCGVDVYLDGVRLQDDFDVLNPRDLAGVEVYAQSFAPAQYRRSRGACHVVLLWLRR